MAVRLGDASLLADVVGPEDELVGADAIAGDGELPFGRSHDVVRARESELQAGLLPAFQDFPSSEDVDLAGAESVAKVAANRDVEIEVGVVSYLDNGYGVPILPGVINFKGLVASFG